MKNKTNTLPIEIPGLYFRPWVGENYMSGFGPTQKRVLVVGESHYKKNARDKNDGDPRNTTLDVIRWQYKGDEPMAFFTKVVSTLSGKQSPLLKEKQRIWDSIAFYNYVQEIVGVGPRIRPSKLSWEKAQQPFLGLLEVLRPEVVVVLGYDLWNHLPDVPDKDKDDAFKSSSGLDGIEACRYSIPTETESGLRAEEFTLAVRVKHPSAIGFASKKWHSDVIERALRWA